MRNSYDKQPLKLGHTARKVAGLDAHSLPKRTVSEPVSSDAHSLPKSRVSELVSSSSQSSLGGTTLATKAGQQVQSPVRFGAQDTKSHGHRHNHTRMLSKIYVFHVFVTILQRFPGDVACIPRISGGFLCP